MKFKLLIFLILFNYHLNLIDCLCSKDKLNSQLKLLLSNCFMQDESRSICECEEIINVNLNFKIFQQLNLWTDKSCKILITSFFICYRIRDKPCEPCLIDLIESLNISESLDLIESNLQQINEYELSNMTELNLEKFDDLQLKNSAFKDRYLIVIAFLVSLLMVSILWCILKYCQRTGSSNFNGSDLFISSTPINNYSPINSMNNISPISLHEDQTRAALLEEVYGVDLPNYENYDKPPPSYQEAVSNSYIKK